MAVSIDRVYQKVLALANKEQRGYITPQEFNLFADHAQMEIFEQYFYDLEQRSRVPGNDLDYGDIITNIEEKISLFMLTDNITGVQQNGEFLISNDVTDVYRLSSVKITYSGSNRRVVADEMRVSEIDKYENSPLAAPTKSSPVYTKFSTDDNPIKIKVYPYPITGDTVTVDYLRTPIPPNWSYFISTDNSALFNSTDSIDFELHSLEENNLVVKILQLAGVAIKDPNLTQVASQKEISTIQQQKQ